MMRGVAIFGLNGAGKSTLAHVLDGTLPLRENLGTMLQHLK